MRESTLNNSFTLTKEIALMDSQYITDISYRHFIESVKDYAIYMLDTEGVVISWNSGAERAKNYTKQEIIGKFYGIFYSQEDQQLEIPEKNLAYAKEHGKFEGEGWRYKKNGSRFWAHVVIDPIYNYKGELDGFAKITKDITEQKNFLDKISYLANYDNLTGLPNRNNFFSLANEQLANIGNQKFVICMISINNLKEIIDNKGYHITDTLIKNIAAHLKKHTQIDEILAQFSNYQFIALKIGDQQQLIEFGQRLSSCFVESYMLDHREIFIDISIGASIYPDDTNQLESLISNADIAMLRAKKEIDNNICFYDKEVDGKDQMLATINLDMLTSLKNNEFFLVYQKKYAVIDNSVSGYEALLRWEHPKFSYLSPELFIPIAEETGKIIPIGYWILDTVCKEALANKLNKKVSVNVSPIQLSDPHFISRVKEILAKNQYPVELLDLEVTETAFMSDRVQALKVLKELQSLGISISLDDFGTGYSSLRLLYDFDFDCIKLDRSFLNSIENNKKAKTFLCSIIALIKNINTHLIVEGVEKQEQLNILKENNCNEIQGFIFGPPDRLNKKY